MARLKITQVKSASRREARQGKTLLALGIRRIRQTVEHEDTPQIRGMVDKVRHLIAVEETQ